MFYHSINVFSSAIPFDNKDGFGNGGRFEVCVSIQTQYVWQSSNSASLLKNVWYGFAIHMWVDNVILIQVG